MPTLQVSTSPTDVVLRYAPTRQVDHPGTRRLPPPNVSLSDAAGRSPGPPLPSSNAADPARMIRVTAAFEVSPDDPQQVAEAIARAAAGAVVHLVRDGQAVADIVPASSQPAWAPRDPRHIYISQMMAERFGAPTLADYRRAYDSHSAPWPGDDYIRRHHPVAGAS